MTTPQVPSTRGLDPELVKILDPIKQRLVAAAQGQINSTSFSSGGVSVVVNDLGEVTIGYDPYTDNTTPPAAADTTHAAGLDYIETVWDAPVYDNHAYTEVYDSGVTLLATVEGNSYIHTNLNMDIRVRHVSLAGVTGPMSGASVSPSAFSLLDTKTDFESGIDVPEVVGTLPPGVQGQNVVFTDNKIYRHDGTGWTTELDGSHIIANSLVGTDFTANTITADQLATDSIKAGYGFFENGVIQTANIASGAVQNGNFAAATIQNAKIDDLQITDTKIDSAAITTAKINGAVIGDAKITDVFATSLTGDVEEIEYFYDNTVYSQSLSTWYTGSEVPEQYKPYLFTSCYIEDYQQIYINVPQTLFAHPNGVDLHVWLQCQMRARYYGPCPTGWAYVVDLHLFRSSGYEVHCIGGLFVHSGMSSYADLVADPMFCDYGMIPGDTINAVLTIKMAHWCGHEHTEIEGIEAIMLGYVV